MLPDPSLNRLLADAVLAVHVGIAAFVVAGLLLTVAGGLARWAWVRNAWFRVAHLMAIGIVVAESWLGIVCPLTTLEMWLRSRAGQATYGGGFVEHWLQRLLYHSAPPWAFIAGYTVFAVLVLATWWRWPPAFGVRVATQGYGSGMNIVGRIVGVLLALIGIVWILQGLNVLPGSFMTGQIEWAVYGAIAFAVGCVLLFVSRRGGGGR